MSRFAIPSLSAARSPNAAERQRRRRPRWTASYRELTDTATARWIGLARTAEALAGGALTVALPISIARSGGTASDVSAMFAAFAVSLLLGQCLWTRLPDHWATPTVAAIALAASGMAIVALATQPTGEGLIALRAVQGGLVGVGAPPLVTWLAHLDGERLGARLGSQSSARLLAFTGGPLVGGVAIEVLPAHAFYAGCGFLVMTTALALLAVRTPPVDILTKTPPMGEAVTRSRSRLTLSIFVGAFAATAAATSTVILTPEFRSLGLSATGIGAALSAMLLTRAALDWRAGRLADRGRCSTPMVVGLLVLAVGTLIVGASGSVTALVIGRIVKGVGMAAFATPALRWAAHRGNIGKASIVGAGFTCGLIGGSIVTGWLAASVSVAAAWIWVLPLTASAWSISRSSAGCSELETNPQG